MKSDKSIHSIVIAKIKRSTIKPYDFKWTRFYEDGITEYFINFPFDLDPEELIICSTIINSSNYSVLTTKKLVTSENGTLTFGSLINAKDKMYRDFKSSNEFTFGNVELANGKI